MSQAHSFFEDPSSDDTPKRNAAAVSPAAAAPCNSDQRGSASGLLPEIRNLLNSAKLCTAFLERQLGDAGTDSDLIDALKTIAHAIDRVSELATELGRSSSNAEAATLASSLTAIRQRAADVATRGIRDVAPAEGEACSELSELEQCLNDLMRAARQTALNGGRVLLRARRQLSASATLPSLPPITQRVAV